MTAPAAAAMARRVAESLMTSSVRYFTLGEPVTDPENGAVTRPEMDTARCVGRVRPATMRDFPAQSVGEEVFASNYVVAVPFGQTPVPAVKQHIVIEASPDPALVGVELQIRQVTLGDNVSARRLLCYKVS
jgi:hypothetical protein